MVNSQKANEWTGNRSFRNRSRDRLFLLSQRFLIWIARRSSAFRDALDGSAYLLANEKRRRLSNAVVEKYGDDTLGGYATKPQSREQILADLRFSEARRLVAETIKLDSTVKRVVEVGAAGGELLNLLAEEFPTVEFIGIDFSIAVAEARHQRPNLEFRRGYFLDDLPDGDLLLFVSTATCLTPAELDAALEVVNSFKWIALSEPWWYGHPIDDHRHSSIHMKGLCFGHNYPGYLRAHGYRVASIKRTKQKSGVERLAVLACAQGAT